MNPRLNKNHASYRKHRRQVWLQIYLPAFVLVILGLSLSVLIGIAAFNETGKPQQWAAISTIWLVLPLLVFGLVFGILVITLIYLVARLLKLLPPYTAKAQTYVYQASHKAKYYSDMAVKPVLFLEGIAASIRSFWGKT